jgi:large subunit ribosomal protein L31
LRPSRAFFADGIFEGLKAFYLLGGAGPLGFVRPNIKEAIYLKQIHAELMLTAVRCTSCGNEFTTRSDRSELVVEVCSNCHPAYTGVERAPLSGSRIERFERRRRLAGRN